MAKVISRESINNANGRTIRGESRNVNMDSKNVSMKYQTSFGSKNIVVSKERIMSAASDALKRSLKK
ncbi:hypothetical protein [Bacteroides ihuae]|uniref:hypothetical protein n=1 Tax=Bacteroides ihuae TaxID=1852362 RepID=UPI0008D954DC|nr:hypothetical protein [Bacteroides ihuae]